MDTCFLVLAWREAFCFQRFYAHSRAQAEAMAAYYGKRPYQADHCTIELVPTPPELFDLWVAQGLREEAA